MRDRLPPPSLPDQTGRTWLVTGATNGIGVEVARAAASAGARVLITARDAGRGERVREQVRAAAVVPLDLADLASVRAAAAGVEEPIDVLVNNAGAFSAIRQETVDGFELMLGTNALGPFAFTNLLADRLRGRVAITASNAHTAARPGDDPHFRRTRFSVPQGYARSKLADMLWGLELWRRLAPRGVDVQLAHPGWAESNLSNVASSKAVNRVVAWTPRLAGQSAADAAQCVLLAATAELPPCSYVGPDGRRHLRGRPTLLGRSAVASDPQEARRWWDFAATETGTDLPPRTR